MTAPTVYHLRNESGIEVFTGTISPAPGGGSQPGAQIIADFLFTQPGAITDYAILAADAVLGTLTIAGNHVARYPPGKQFKVDGSTLNDNEYNVLSSALVGGQTVITVNPLQASVLDNTADGVVQGGLVAVLALPEGATVYDVELLPQTPWTDDSGSIQLDVCNVVDGNVDALNYFYSGVALSDFTDAYDPITPAASNYASLSWLPGVGTYERATPFPDPALTIKPGGGVPYPNGGSICMSIVYLETAGGDGQMKIRVKYASAPTVVNAA